jgi:hypothetical protein
MADSGKSSHLDDADPEEREDQPPTARADPDRGIVEDLVALQCDQLVDFLALRWTEFEAFEVRPTLDPGQLNLRGVGLFVDTVSLGLACHRWAP